MYHMDQLPDYILSMTHEIAFCISQSPQHCWWSLILAEIRPVLWVACACALRNIYTCLYISHESEWMEKSRSKAGWVGWLGETDSCNRLAPRWDLSYLYACASLLINLVHYAASMVLAYTLFTLRYTILSFIMWQSCHIAVIVVEFML